MPDAPKYMDEVTVYDVQDAKTGEHIAVFMTDYFPRPSKVQGAWMEQLQSSGLYEDGNRRPVVYNVGNFTRPTADAPALLSIDEVETTFHEFGHALQSILSQAPYRSIAGTNVDRDYVELSSQMNEHFLLSNLNCSNHTQSTTRPERPFPTSLSRSSTSRRNSIRDSSRQSLPEPLCSTWHGHRQTPTASRPRPSRLISLRK